MEPTVRFPEFKDSWNNYSIEDIFDRVGTPVDLDDTQTYREIGIRSHGKGIFHKEETTATEIGNKRVFWVEPGCFVVNIVFAWERAVAKTTENENGMIASHRFPMYKPKKDIVDLDYITEYFITKRGQNVLILASPGGAGRNKTLGQKEFAKSIVKLPSLPEQQKIAKFLLTVDTVIEKQRETVFAWEERKKGVMQKLFSQEIRFKADDGKTFPDWEEHKIKEFVTESKIPGHTGKEAKKLTVKLWAKGIIPKEQILSGSENTQYYIRHAGQLMYGKLDFLNCAFGIVPSELDGYESTLDSPAFDIHGILDKFLLCYITRKSFYKKNGDIANGSRKAKRIHPDVFGEMSINVPCIPEQQKIANCLSAFDDVIEKQKATLAAWEELKKGLLQQMFV